MKVELLNIGLFALVYTIGELLVHYLIFGIWLNRKFGLEKSAESNAQFKGHLERLMLYLSFCAGLPQVVIAFGGIKIGAWFMQKDDASQKVAMDFFLIGNIVSITLSILYFLLWRSLLPCIGISCMFAG